MSEQLIAEPAPTCTSRPAGEHRDEGYCPECGQSLDLTRHRETPIKRRTLEPFVFLIFGLCLTVAFGMRAWHTHVGMVGLGQEMASWRVAQGTVGTFPKPGNP